ncbi:hypothetical protein [Streptomyces sp. CAU 1734]|uniref:hypothetical protein n=1 Tax=Streptomyces sp. CAU 1734 TaxID=3140360 RepID=UPI0032601FB9
MNRPTPSRSAAPEGPAGPGRAWPVPEPLTHTEAVTAFRRPPPRAVIEAVRDLTEALTAHQLQPFSHTPRDGHVCTMAITDFRTYTLAGVDVGGKCTDESAQALKQGLRRHGIAAQVTRVTGPLISLPTLDDVHRMTDLVWRDLPDTYRTAHRLRRILEAMDDRSGGLGDFLRPRVVGDAVEIGDLTVTQALLLVRLLGGTVPRATRARCTCPYLGKVARLLRGRLRTVLPGVAVVPKPICGSDADGHRITVGAAPIDRIRALNERIETAVDAYTRVRPGRRRAS